MLLRVDMFTYGDRSTAYPYSRVHTLIVIEYMDDFDFSLLGPLFFATAKVLIDVYLVRLL